MVLLITVGREGEGAFNFLNVILLIDVRGEDAGESTSRPAPLLLLTVLLILSSLVPLSLWLMN